MASVFIARTELLPPGETLEEHKKWQKEEADAVQQDKDNTDTRTGGLFRGCFKTHSLHGRGPSLQVLRDQEDGVDRCPVCTWELEDGGCQQCGLIFDESGEVSWGDSFTGFSDMDEMSEHDTEDMDAEMEMDDVDYGAYENWEDYLPDQGSFVMRRFLEAGIPPNAAAFARRRPLTHSEAGSRRSYTQSIVSDIYGDEMDTVEEEDEDAEEDSEMNDFIDDDEDVEGSASASVASSTPGPTSQQSASRARPPGRARRVVESETSSSISNVIEEEEDEDDDEEEQGPIRRGQRNPAQARVLNRANGSHPNRRAPSSISTDVSTDELDEDTQALLRDAGWGMLQPDDEGTGEEDDEDSDGGRTTVGWEPLANSNDRSRMGGSLTPTADRSRPSAPIRPPSRTGNIHLMNASRGLRRRSSVLSSSAIPYEDGEADDDDSDQEGDATMAMNALRNRRSQTHMRTMAAFSNPRARFGSRTPVQGGAGHDLDGDDHSDTSQPGSGRRGVRTQRREEYDPRISWMFAAHQQALQEHQMTGALIDVEPRSITPITRPGTSNRNRPSPAQVYSPFMPPSRLRTPLMDNTSNFGPGHRLPVSPPRRSAMSPGLPPMAGVGNLGRMERPPSIGSTSNGSVVFTPGTSTPTSEQSIDGTSQTHIAASMDMIDRPESRVGARPPSATGRRGSANFPPVYPSFHNAGVGLHVQGSALAPYQARGNPWAAFVQARGGLRNRNSRQLLREQSSVATLRPTGSRVNLRDGAHSPQVMRPQASRINLRTQPSRRQLINQASTRTLRAGDHGRPPPSPGLSTQNAGQPTARPIRLSQDERDTRARELIETRRRALGQPNSVPTATNPFHRRVGNAANTISAQSPASVQHSRSNSNESMQSVNSSGTISAAPTSPVLGRRRSNRNMMGAPPPGVLTPAQGDFTSPVTSYGNSYYRPRQGSVNGAPNAYEPTLNGNTRGMHSMAAGPLI